MAPITCARRIERAPRNDPEQPSLDTGAPIEFGCPIECCEEGLLHDVFHIDRGYPLFVENLALLGAEIERVCS